MDNSYACITWNSFSMCLQVRVCMRMCMRVCLCVSVWMRGLLSWNKDMEMVNEIVFNFDTSQSTLSIKYYVYMVKFFHIWILRWTAMWYELWLTWFLMLLLYLFSLLEIPTRTLFPFMSICVLRCSYYKMLNICQELSMVCCKCKRHVECDPFPGITHICLFPLDSFYAALYWQGLCWVGISKWTNHNLISLVHSFAAF